MPNQLSDEDIQNIKDLQIKGDWQVLLEQHAQGGDEKTVMLWPSPDYHDLVFIRDVVKLLNKSTLVSIGCGTGFLEWCLSQATGLEVLGVEIDRKYWSQPRNQMKLFIRHTYLDDEDFDKITTSEENALMFCYFNNRKAFINYIENYRGDCLVILGPHNAGRYTDPGPFDPLLNTYGYALLQSKEIRNKKDFIAIYKKLKN